MLPGLFLLMYYRLVQLGGHPEADQEQAEGITNPSCLWHLLLRTLGCRWGKLHLGYPV